MSSNKFPASIPRKMYWSHEIGGFSSCPDCGAALETEYHTYLMTTRQRGEMDFFIVGNAAGHFCGRCPVVVLEREEFQGAVAAAVQETAGVAFTVMGIVDLDAIPEEKRDVPLGDDDNPIPLVRFTNVGSGNAGAISTKTRSRRAKSKRRKKSRRR